MTEQPGERTGVKAAVITLAVVVIAVTGTLVAIYSGAYDVAATSAHGGLTEWLLETVKERSIQARAARIDGQPPTDSAQLAHGFEHFHAMCVECHGAPGIEPSEAGEGLYPEPPELDDETEEWSDAELFWIIKYGIKFTGMPAFGPTHTDSEIWSIVGFMHQLETLSTDDYAALVASLEADGADHEHAPGTPEHEH